jgi:photosystem II stability/assembly factor-like uncharacterized protein
MKTLILVCFIAMSSSLHAQWVEQNSGLIKNFYDIRFLNDTVGFASGWDQSGAAVTYTINGGKSWTTSAIDSALVFGIALRDGYPAIIVGYDAKCDCAAIYTNFISPHSNWAKLQFPATFGFYAVDFPSPETGFVSGYDGGIYKSTDGGISWTQLETGTTDDVFRVMKFASPDAGFAASGTSYNLLDRFWRTTDGGTSWEMVQDYKGTRSIGGIYFRDSLTGFMVGNDYKAWESVYKTTDGGDTWTNVWSGPDKDIVLDGIDFANDKIGYAVGAKGRILKTTDGGDTWNIDDSPTTEFLTAVSLPSPGKAYAAGFDGVIFANLQSADVKKENSDGMQLQVMETGSESIFRFVSSAGASVESRLHIFDVLGREIRNYLITGEELRIAHSTLTSGSYYWVLDSPHAKMQKGKFLVS